VSGVLRWEKPPKHTAPAGRRGGTWSRWSGVADDLRAHPGEWALVAEGPDNENTSLATHIRMGQMSCFAPAGEFDAEAHRGGGIRKVWAVYLGEDSPP